MPDIYQGKGGSVYTGTQAPINKVCKYLLRNTPKMKIKGITLLWESKVLNRCILVFCLHFFIGLTTNKQEQIHVPFIALRL